MQNIFIGNLAANTSEQKLREVFGAFGEVSSVNVVTNRDTGEPRGFAFVEMRNEPDAKAAIAAINGTLIDERIVNVNEARPKSQNTDTFPGQMRRHRQHRY